MEPAIAPNSTKKLLQELQMDNLIYCQLLAVPKPSLFGDVLVPNTVFEGESSNNQQNILRCYFPTVVSFYQNGSTEKTE